MPAMISLIDLEQILNDYGEEQIKIMKSSDSKWTNAYDASQKLSAVSEIKKVIIEKMKRPVSDEYDHWLKTA